MRRKLSSAAPIDPNDRRILSGRVAPKHDDPRHRAHPADGVQVVDDFRKVIPITQGELDVIETYLGALLDDMLKPLE
jgi:hypothetical protein